MYLPLALQRWHVWCYVHTSIHLLFTWQMFSVRPVQWYNFPHVTTVNASLVSSDSSSHTYATSWRCSLRTEQCHTSCRNTACSVFAFAANTHGTAVVFLLQASAANALLPVDWAGMQLDWSAPWNATSCHIFLLRMDNQFVNENLTEIFVCHFATTWLVYKKCV